MFASPCPSSPKKKPSRLAAWLTVSAALLLPLAASAQNVAIVNGKAVPKSRVEALLVQATSQGQPRTPELEAQVRDGKDAFDLSGEFHRRKGQGRHEHRRPGRRLRP